MPRYDGRIEPGQKINSAISARAWNRAQEAADIVLQSNPSARGGPVMVPSLPCVKVALPVIGYFGEVRVPSNTGTSTASLTTPSMPVSSTRLANLSNNEKKMVTFLNVPTELTAAGMNFITKLFICVGNNDNVYAISGFAITRLRVWSNDHRYARPPVNLGSTSEVAGSLDSAFFGPARIVGYFTSDGVLKNPMPTQTSDPITYPNTRYCWALVCL